MEHVQRRVPRNRDCQEAECLHHGVNVPLGVEFMLVKNIVPELICAESVEECNRRSAQ